MQTRSQSRQIRESNASSSSEEISSTTTSGSEGSDNEMSFQKNEQAFLDTIEYDNVEIPKEVVSNLTHNKFNENLVIGDVVTFDVVYSQDPDYNPGELSRSPSNYGMQTIEHYYKREYTILNIINDNGEYLIEIFPKKLIENEEIMLWYINLSKMEVQEKETGDKCYRIKNFKKPEDKLSDEVKFILIGLWCIYMPVLYFFLRSLFVQLL